MRADGREERKSPFLVCACLGGPVIEGQTDLLRVPALQFRDLGQLTKPLEPRCPFLRCLPSCPCFLLGSGGSVALTLHAQLGLEG